MNGLGMVWGLGNEGAQDWPGLEWGGGRGGGVVARREGRSRGVGMGATCLAVGGMRGGEGESEGEGKRREGRRDMGEEGTGGVFLLGSAVTRDAWPVPDQASFFGVLGLGGWRLAAGREAGWGKGRIGRWKVGLLNGRRGGGDGWMDVNLISGLFSAPRYSHPPTYL